MTMGKFSQLLQIWEFILERKFYWMISVSESLPFFPHALENLRTHTAKEHKEWGTAFTDVSYIRKNTQKPCPDAKSLNVSALEKLSVIPVFTDTWELILEGTLGMRSMWWSLSLSFAVSGHKIYWEQNVQILLKYRINFINIPFLVWPLAHSICLFCFRQTLMSTAIL